MDVKNRINNLMNQLENIKEECCYKSMRSKINYLLVILKSYQDTEINK